jgi:hypothetical protein
MERSLGIGSQIRCDGAGRRRCRMYNMDLTLQGSGGFFNAICHVQLKILNMRYVSKSWQSGRSFLTSRCPHGATLSWRMRNNSIRTTRFSVRMLRCRCRHPSPLSNRVSCCYSQGRIGREFASRQTLPMECGSASGLPLLIAMAALGCSADSWVSTPPLRSSRWVILGCADRRRVAQ